MCHLPVTILADAKSNGEEPPLLQKLREAVKNFTAMAFFGIRSNSDIGGAKWSFQSSSNFFV